LSTNSVIIPCGRCGQKLRVAENRPSDRIRCPKCSSTLTLDVVTRPTGDSRSSRVPRFVRRVGRRLWRRRAAVGVVLCFLAVAGLVVRTYLKTVKTQNYPDNWPVFAGANFTPEPFAPDLAIPEFTPVPVPNYPGAFAIWGAVGADAKGMIWFSGASHTGEVQSAHLFRYDPTTDSVTPWGDAVSELKRCGLHRPGERQVKIHTKFITAADGKLYFATTDDPSDGSGTDVRPKWGGHLWRLSPNERNWEHLLAVPDGLIALVGDGTRLYALAYPGHVLVQYDTRSGAVKSVDVGSADGHVSRHILADRRGHAYVPRLKKVRADYIEHTLVEFDADLREIAQFPLPHYQNGAADQCHGIIAYQPLADGSIVFTTHAGRLFRLVVPKLGQAGLEDLGFLHPKGRSYASGLFAFNGDRYVFGLTNIQDRWEWVTFDLINRTSGTQAVVLPREYQNEPYLYGCVTRDGSGNFYVVGGHRRSDNSTYPIMCRVRLSK
jgi:DNA-directed RNA polymerase subunit RPC12/RpoP